MPSTEYVSKDGSLNDLLAKAYGRKPTEQELDKFCEDARKAADAKAPAFDPEPANYNHTSIDPDKYEHDQALRRLLSELKR